MEPVLPSGGAGWVCQLETLRLSLFFFNRHILVHRILKMLRTGNLKFMQSQGEISLQFGYMQISKHLSVKYIFTLIFLIYFYQCLLQLH